MAKQTIGKTALAKIKKLEKELKALKSENRLFSTSLNNANKLFAEKIKEMSIIRRVGDSISSSLSKKDVSLSLVNILISELTAENCSVMLLTDDKKRLLLKVAKGQTDKQPRYFEDEEALKLKNILVGQGIAGWVAKKGKSVLIKDIKKNKRFISFEGGLKGITSLLCMPITNEKGVIGVLNLSHPHIGTFSDENERFLKIILNATSLAFYNIRLYEESKNFAHHLEEVVNKRTCELKDSATKYKTLMQYGSDGIILVSLESGNILECNHTASELLGIRADKLIGQASVSLFSKNSPRFIDMLMESGKKTQKSFRANTYIRKKRRKTDTPVSLTSSIISLADGQVLYLTIRDITEEVKFASKLRNYSAKLEAEVEKRSKELEKAQNEIIQAEKLSSLGRLASGVAHEINNPISIIKGYSENFWEMLDRGEAVDANDLKKTFSTIIEACERCTNITNDILDFSRPREKSESLCNIKHTILTSLQMVKAKPRSFDKKFEYSGKALNCSIRTDMGYLEQVITNLLNNAVDASPNGGTIFIDVVKTAKLLKIAITDNGHGITKQNLSNIFNPFFTTKAPCEGTGLGLSVSYRMIQVLGGEINVVSKPAKTTFTITLPLK